MRNLLAALFAMAATAVMAQTKVCLSGMATEGAKTVYIYDGLDTRGACDSVAVDGGKWHYEAVKPANVYFLTVTDRHQVDGKDTQLAFIMADTVATEIIFPEATVKGSKASVAANETIKQLMALMQGHKTPEAEEKALSAMRNAVMDNLDSMLPVVFVPMIAGGLSAGDLQAIFHHSAPYYNLPEMASARERLNMLTGNSVRSIGKMFTDMTMADTNGVEHKLSEWCGKGRYVLIDFWASWCGPCRAEMPYVVAAYGKYHDKGLDIIGVSFDQNKDAWLKAIENLNMPWTHLSDLKGWQSLGAKIYEIRSIPANILLDGEGKIIDTDLRGEMLGMKLAELFGER